VTVQSIPDTPPVLAQRRAYDALQKAGFGCVLRDKAVVCDEQNQKKPTLMVMYGEAPPRLVLLVQFQLKRPCSSVLPTLNAFNTAPSHLTNITLACRDPYFLATGGMLLPPDGVSVEYFSQYARWWTDSLLLELRDTHLAELLR
jgi:hypothetical protein